MKFFIAVFLSCVVATLSPAQSTGGGGTVYLRQLERGTAGYVITGQGAGGAPIYTALAGAGIGDFSGPAAATDNAIVRFDGVGGKTGQNSVVTIADTTGAMSWPATTNALISGGSSGASLTLGQGANASATTVTTGTGMFVVGTIGTTTRQNILRITGGNNTGSYAPVLSFFRTATAEGFAAVNNAGNLLIGNSGGLADYTDATLLANASILVTNVGVTKILGTTAATSTTTGSFQNAGGFGNTGAIFAGGGVVTPTSSGAFSAFDGTTTAAGGYIQNIVRFDTGGTPKIMGYGYNTTSGYTGGFVGMSSNHPFYFIIAGLQVANFATTGIFSVSNANSGIEIGSPGTTNTPYIDFHSSASVTDYDARLTVTGGTAGNGAGTLSVTAGTTTFSGNVTGGANLTVMGVLSMGGPVSPASGSTGTAGMIIWDANYIYICIAANTWKRAALSAY